MGLAELLPDLAVPLRQSGHLGEVVSPELNYPANTQLYQKELVLIDINASTNVQTLLTLFSGEGLSG